MTCSLGLQGVGPGNLKQRNCLSKERLKGGTEQGQLVASPHPPTVSSSELLSLLWDSGSAHIMFHSMPFLKFAYPPLWSLLQRSQVGKHYIISPRTSQQAPSPLALH